MRVMVFAFASSVISFFSIHSVYAQSADYDQDILLLDTEISKIETEAQKYGDGLIKTVMTARKEILQLSIDALKFLKLTDDGNINKEYILELPKTDLVRASLLLEEIQKQTSAVAAAEREASAAGGLIQALAFSRVETEKLTLSQLKLGYFQAMYGLPIQTISQVDTNSSFSEEKTVGLEEKTNAVELVEWADPNYPSINYDTALFSALSGDFDFHGYWAIKEEKSEIDDSPEIKAILLEDWNASSSGNQKSFFVGCVENSTRLMYNADNYLMNKNYNSNSLRVTYRIDDQPAINTRWEETTSNNAVGLFGVKAEKFLPKLYNANKLFIRVKESNGESHDATFNLDGIPETLDKIGDICSFSVMNLTVGDYKAIQTLLNAGGFKAGKPDGIWGSGSKAALKMFQESKGLKITGAINKETVKALGL